MRVLFRSQLFFGGEVVDCGGRLARVDRPAYHHQRTRLGLAARGHQRYRRQHRNGRPADTDNLQVLRADLADDIPDVDDVVVEPERARLLAYHSPVYTSGQPPQVTEGV